MKFPRQMTSFRPRLFNRPRTAASDKATSRIRGSLRGNEIICVKTIISAAINAATHKLDVFMRALVALIFARSMKLTTLSRWFHCFKAPTWLLIVDLLFARLLGHDDALQMISLTYTYTHILRARLLNLYVSMRMCEWLCVCLHIRNCLSGWLAVVVNMLELISIIVALRVG